MPHPTDEKYFHTLKEWSERKLKLLENYLEPATRIMKSIHPTVYYVDCFAGRGTYGRPGEPQIPGSPIRAAQLAQGYIDEGKPYSLRCINVESDPKIFQGLQDATANYSHITQNFQGTFVDNINNTTRGHT